MSKFLFSTESTQVVTIRFRSHSDLIGNIVKNLKVADVTLVTCDNKSYPVHEAVIAKCSGFFESALPEKDHDHKHTKLKLRFIKGEILKKILEFMYKGNTCVERKNWPSFVKCSKKLKIIGVSENIDEAVNQNNQIVTNNLKNNIKSINEEIKSQTSKPVKPREEAECLDSEKERDGMFDSESTEQVFMHVNITDVPMIDSEDLGFLADEHCINEENVAKICKFLDSEQEKEKSTLNLMGLTKLHKKEKQGEKEEHQICSTVHLEEKPFICPTCKKGFKSKSELAQHLTVHSDKRPFICTTCGKGFKTNLELTRHLAVHSQEKLFICPTCKKGFKRKENLTRHLRVHSEERSFKCTTCGKGFKSYQELTQHLAVHTDKRPFMCQTCDKCFKTNQELTQHLTVHLEEKPFTCPTCNKGFKLKKHLKRHRAVHAKHVMKALSLKKI